MTGKALKFAEIQTLSQPNKYLLNQWGTQEVELVQSTFTASHSKFLFLEKKWNTGHTPRSLARCYFKRATSVKYCYFSVAKLCLTLKSHGMQHTRPPYPSPSLRICSSSCPLNWWCHPTTSSCCPLSLLPSVFPSIRVFSNESVLHIRWPKYWSCGLSISPSNEYSGLISFRIDWFDLFAVQGTLKSLLQHQSLKA